MCTVIPSLQPPHGLFLLSDIPPLLYKHRTLKVCCPEALCVFGRFASCLKGEPEGETSVIILALAILNSQSSNLHNTYS